MRIYDIQSPQDIKNLSYDQLKFLCEEIRQFLIQNISKTGGHLSSNLGVVELTVALHYVFNAPEDKFIFDVGHQCYTHKILTGRSPYFSTLRKKDGLSGFQKRKESEYDCWEAGHSSTSLSAALGFACARDLLGYDYEVIPIIGDGALGSGMSMEALNDIGTQQRKIIMVFNDNNMSISKNHSAIEQKITNLRTSNFYQTMKIDVKKNLKESALGTNLLKSMTHLRDHIKEEVIDAPLFENFNINYLGPVDGHDLHALIKAFHAAKNAEGPIVVHVITKKGKGYSFAEKDEVGKWHGVSPFDIETGRSIMKVPSDELSWSEIVSRTLIDLAKKDSRIVAITPAMAQGSKLLEFQRKYPKRFFDCGIAEEHAITMACGMAQAGLKPFISIYSSFLQRGYDQINHDLARMNLPVVIGVDRAGLVGDDGETHQGVFDISFLRSIPNLILSQPKDAQEAQNLLYSAFLENKPYFIRYPRGYEKYKKVDSYQYIQPGTWTKTIVGENPGCIVICYGPEVDKVIKKAKVNHVSLIVVNARFFKPLDTDMLDELFKMNLKIHVYQTDCKKGSLASAILEYKNQSINILGIEDHFVQHGSIRSLRIEEKIDINTLFEQISESENEIG